MLLFYNRTLCQELREKDCLCLLLEQKQVQLLSSEARTDLYWWLLSNWDLLALTEEFALLFVEAEAITTAAERSMDEVRFLLPLFGKIWLQLSEPSFAANRAQIWDLLTTIAEPHIDESDVRERLNGVQSVLSNSLVNPA